jgi:hypothetical protein
VTIFAPMDSWVAAAGRSDEWLAVGLGLLDGWQQQIARPGAAEAGQAHLCAVLAALDRLRPDVRATPDPLVLAVWFHHAGGSDLERGAAVAWDALCGLGEPHLADQVARLVRRFAPPQPAGADLSGGLLAAAHRFATAPLSMLRPAPVPPVTGDQ